MINLSPQLKKSLICAPCTNRRKKTQLCQTDSCSRGVYATACDMSMYLFCTVFFVDLKLQLCTISFSSRTVYRLRSLILLIQGIKKFNKKQEDNISKIESKMKGFLGEKDSDFEYNNETLNINSEYDKNICDTNSNKCLSSNSINQVYSSQICSP